jgi:phosphopantothenoylcysteine synthetase/decarboxylase
MNNSKTWKNRRVLITMGPMRAYIDPVRYIANCSTGGLGTALANHLSDQGAEVVAVAGAAEILPQYPVSVNHITTFFDFQDMLKNLSAAGEIFDAVFHLMAVLDYIPEDYLSKKIDSGRGELVLRLAPTPKMIDELKELFPDAFLVGFKLESGLSLEQLLERGRALMRRSGADACVCNLTEAMGQRNHRAYLVDRTGLVAEDGWIGKDEIARNLAAWTAGQL